jgi:hypothetical protein
MSGEDARTPGAARPQSSALNGRSSPILAFNCRTASVEHCQIAVRLAVQKFAIANSKVIMDRITTGGGNGADGGRENEIVGVTRSLVMSG